MSRKEVSHAPARTLRCPAAAFFCALVWAVALAPLCQAAQTATPEPSSTLVLFQRPTNKNARKKPAPEKSTGQHTRTPQDDPHGIQEMDNFLGKVLAVVKYVIIGIVALVIAFYAWFFLYDKVYEPLRASEFLAGLRIRRSLKKLLEGEASALDALGIPHPTQRTTLFTRKGNINPPTFDVPPHLLFKVRQLADLPLDDLYDAPHYARFTPHLVYFIAEDSDIVERALEDFKTKGLHHVVASYEGLWLNRAPYALYKFLNEQEPLSTQAFCEEVRKPVDERRKVDRNNPSSWPLPPLEEVDGIPADHLHKITQRAFLFYTLTGDIIPQPPPDDLYISEPLPAVIPDEIIYHLPLPPPMPLEDWVTFKILPHADARAALVVQFLDSVRNAAALAFELIAENDTMYFQLSCPPGDRDLVERQVETHFPSFAVIERENTLTLASPFHALTARPFYPNRFLKTDFALDPYNQLFGVLARAGCNDAACAQFLFSPVSTQAFTMIADYLEEYRDHYRHSRKERLLEQWDRLMEKHGAGSSGYAAYDPAPDINERLRELERKLPAWLVGVRLLSTNPHLLDDLKRSFLHQYETPHQTWVVSDTTTTEAVTRRLDAGNVVSTQELAALVHFPSKEIACDRLETVSMKSKLPPALFTGEGIALGNTHERGKTTPVTVPEAVRDRHLYVVGKTRTGKSTLLLNLARQDIAQGKGVTIVDPHGDLIEDVLCNIPKERVEDTVYFDAADKEHPIPLNILNAKSDEEIDLLANDLLVTFRRLSENWGERMESILRYTFHTLLRTPGTTFLDVQRILQDQGFREQMLSQIHSAPLVDYWRHQFPNLPKDAVQPILSRMSKFILSPTLFGILGQADSALSFYDVIQNRKILLVNLSQGRIGDDNAKLLGSLIVSQIQLAVMRRAALPKEERTPYFLYVDEFQNFTTSAFEKILSEAGKYKLCLTLAHQYISQLDDALKEAILGNVGTIIMFSLGPKDAHCLRDELGAFEPQDLTNLSAQAHEALCRPATRSGDTFEFTTLPPPDVPSANYVQQIIEYTRENYSHKPMAQAAAAEGSIPSSAASPAIPPPQLVSETLRAARPQKAALAQALPKEFATNQDKALYFITLAEYLSTQQIIQLCYTHIAKSARATTASRDLRALVADKKLKNQPFGKGKIYYTSRTCNPTTHNLAVRDLFVKIVLSGFEIAEVSFAPDLKTLIPDLYASFLAKDGTLIKTFWEYDTGSEGVGEMMKKVKRYEPLSADHFITCVVTTPERLAQLRKAIKEPFLAFAVMSEFETLNDPAFESGDREERFPFFTAGG